MWPPPWQPWQPAANPNAPYRNDTGSVPDNSYEKAFWLVQKQYVQWEDPAAIEAAHGYYGPLERCQVRGLWSSTVIDFRPDLKGAMGYDPNATGIRGAGYGMGIDLAIQVSYTQINIPFRVFSLEFCNLYDPNDMRRAQNVQDITADFFDAQVTSDETSTVILTFRPPSTTRYWRTALVFDILDDNGPVDPTAYPEISFAASSW